MKRAVYTVISFLISASCFAIPEVQFSSQYESLIVPFTLKNLHAGNLTAADGTKLAYATFINPDPKARAVVFVPGRTEFYLKYTELAYDLFEQGYSVFILDPRGQGLSQRLLSDPQVGYVADFKDYVSDLNLFVDRVVLPQSSDKIFFSGAFDGGSDRNSLRRRASRSRRGPRSHFGHVFAPNETLF